MSKEYPLGFDFSFQKVEVGMIVYIAEVLDALEDEVAELQQPINVKIKKFYPDAVIPVQATSGSVGFDLVAHMGIMIYPGRADIVPTGIALEIPRGYEAQVRPRSGLALFTSLVIPNSPGTIDSDFRGEVSIIFRNIGKKPHWVRKGDKIAQLVFQKVPDVQLIEVDELDETKRGGCGFGSTDKSINLSKDIDKTKERDSIKNALEPLLNALNNVEGLGDQEILQILTQAKNDLIQKSPTKPKAYDWFYDEYK